MPIRRPFREALSWRRRLLAATPAILAHLALLAALWISLPPKVPPIEQGGGGPTLSYIELAAPPSPPSPLVRIEKVDVPPPAPTAEADPSAPKLIEHPEDLGLPAPRSDIEPEPLTDPTAPATVSALAGPPVPSDPCQLAQTLQLALQADARIQGALALIPRDSRSVANAIMFWDGRWVAVNALGGEAALEPIREAIVQGLATAPPDCRERFNSGPILVTVEGPAGATVLVVGSGPWRVADLIAQGPELNRP
ncbi:MAG: hypothetical protein H0X27_04805 [Caulobacteraceae bacterium]|nr:hypothetical protein [Caulobacteraceae bacterium]